MARLLWDWGVGPAPTFAAGDQVESIAGMRGEIIRYVGRGKGGAWRVKWANGVSGLIAAKNLRYAETPAPPALAEIEGARDGR